MNRILQKAFISGAERVSAWADLIDSINVFPVADGDTGRNLTISLAPLRQLDEDREYAIRQLLVSSCGNSGNIAASFFSKFLKADSSASLFQAAVSGRDSAWQSVSHPRQGTMLTVFDALVEILEDVDIRYNNGYVSEVIDYLGNAVKSTSNILPQLKDAGVVDAGALGIYIYLESFFNTLVGKKNGFRSLFSTFRDRLQLSSSFRKRAETGHCVNMIINLDDNLRKSINKLAEYGKNVVVIPENDYLKVHIHTDNKKKLRKRIESLGDLIQWKDADIAVHMQGFQSRNPRQPLHLMTDAAGSLTREEAQKLGITLLDSYIMVGKRSLPETFLTPERLYASMRNGVKVTTSQASVFERNQSYQSVLDRYQNILYLCAGSFFTGNYGVAAEWKQKNDPSDRFKIIDTGAASGRLGTIVIATAMYLAKTDNFDSVCKFALRAVHKCKEYIFLDKLKYLAAGGRLAKSNAFFGDIFNVKPVLSQTVEGIQKIGTAKNRDGQLEFALEKLEKELEKKSSPFIMLEYSDNKSWINDTVKKKITKLFPLSEISVKPFSLTSGVHMGPGTWAVAFLPESV